MQHREVHYSLPGALECLWHKCNASLQGFESTSNILVSGFESKEFKSSLQSVKSKSSVESRVTESKESLESLESELRLKFRVFGSANPKPVSRVQNEFELF